MAIKRITYDEAVRSQPEGHLSRRTVSDADDRNIAQRERDGAVNRLVVLEREVTALKERFALSRLEAQSLAEIGAVDGDGAVVDFTYLDQLLDLSKTLPAPQIVTPDPEAQ